MDDYNLTCRKCKRAIPSQSVYCLYCGCKVDVAHRGRTRANGAGCVYKRGNTWTIKKTIAWESDGDHLIRRTISKGGFRTKKEAAAYAPLLDPTAIKERERQICFKDAYDRFIEEHSDRVSHSTVNCYNAAIAKFEHLYSVNIADIDIDDLQDCMDGQGKRTQQNMKAAAGLVYKWAIPRHYCDLNIAQYLHVHGEELAEREGLPLDVVDIIRDRAQYDKNAAIVLIHIYTGFRPQEFLTAVYDRKSNVFVGGSKTDAGRNRTVTISPKIQPYVDDLARDTIKGPLLNFSIEQYRSLFYKVLDSCGVENPMVDGRRRYTPHSCRHTFATLMKNVAAADKDKQKLIGHSSAEMLRYYQDVDVQSLKNITDVI